VAGRDTQERLIDTAERLFAEHGFDGVTFKQITTEAGQRNASALQYHFGTKQALVQAIVMRRMPAINDRRHAMLDELEESGRDRDLRGIVCAMVLPLAEQLDDGTETGRRFYIRFLSQVLSNPRSAIVRLAPLEVNSGTVRAGTMAAALMTQFPPEILRQRLMSLLSFVVGALSNYERGTLDGSGDRPSAVVFVNNLIDTIVGMLTAPVSPETQMVLERQSAAECPGRPDSDPADG